MDINQALAEARNLAWQIDTATDHVERSTLAVMLAEKFRDIDKWLTGGGFRPRAWDK